MQLVRKWQLCKIFWASEFRLKHPNKSLLIVLVIIIFIYNFSLQNKSWTGQGILPEFYNQGL